MASVISVPQFAQLQSGPERVQLIDVRSPSEYATGHIPGAVNMPMDQVQSRLPDLEREGAIVLVCQSGQRARMVAGLLEPCGKELRILEGGTSAWIKAGLPVVATSVTRWSLERQVRFAAGLFVLTGVVLALTTSLYLDISRRFHWSRADFFRRERPLPHGKPAGLNAMEPWGLLQL